MLPNNAVLDEAPLCDSKEDSEGCSKRNLFISNRSEFLEASTVSFAYGLRHDLTLLQTTCAQGYLDYDKLDEANVDLYPMTESVIS